MKTLGLCLAIAASPMAVGQKLSRAEKAYVGGYTQGGVDAVTRIVLLEDRTFCFAFTGGALDLLAAGYWQTNPGKDGGITLHEVRAEQALFPALIENNNVPGDTVVFSFDALSLSEAESAVFAVSSSDEAPTEMRPLFSLSGNSWPSRYTLPPLKATEARYFYIGYAERDELNRPTRLNVVQYAVNGGSAVLIGFNPIQAKPLMKMSAKLVGNVLHVGGERFGERDTLPMEVMEDVRINCIDPVLRPATARTEKCAGDQDSDCNSAEYGSGTMLAPVKTWHINLKAVTGSPWINRGK